MPKYAKISNLWAFELGQKQRATCSTPCKAGRARTGCGNARPARGRLAPRVCTSPSPISASRGLSRWHSHTQSPARARDHRSSPWKASTTARHLHPSSAVVASPFCWPLASPQPLDRFPVKPWRSSKLESRHCLTGEADSPSPDFGRLPPRVGREIRWAILQFLAPLSFLTSSEALWPVHLDNRAVSRPDSSPPTSISACARGPADSDHPWWRPALRRDPRGLPYILDHLTGVVSPPVSPSAPFFLHGHCSLREGPRVRFCKTLGGFLQSRRLKWIVHRGPVCNSFKMFRQGPQRKTAFPLTNSN
jgi:hypothetical protein